MYTPLDSIAHPGSGSLLAIFTSQSYTGLSYGPCSVNLQAVNLDGPLL